MAKKIFPALNIKAIKHGGSMQVNSISNFNHVSYGQRHISQEIRNYSDGFRRMAESPIYDSFDIYDMPDADEIAFRTGFEETQLYPELKRKAEIQQYKEDKLLRQISASESIKFPERRNVTSKEAIGLKNQILDLLQAKKATLSAAQKDKINHLIRELRSLLRDCIIGL